ncbi:hypothetical protein SDC9_56335 [bioreactor metagenome]|uniref:Tripartite tricarboxylate transporter family receptor n=1 Tax=bioreactor metagenome TaxID=1076179 RepID=A0A644X2A4_9ZZZZ
MKKIVSILLAVLLLAAIATGCSSGTSSSPTASPSASASVAPSTTPAESGWPTSTVQIMLPSSAGGATDLIGRGLSAFLQDKLGQPFVVVNQNDGGGVVAFETVRNAKPDGNTILLDSCGMIVGYNAGLYDKHPLDDFAIVAVMPAGGSYSVVVAPDSPYNSMEDLLNAADANPDTITCGVQFGNSSHMMGAMLKYDTNAKFRFVEAGSDQDKLAAMQGKQMTFAFINTKNAAPYMEAGKLKVLATIGGTADRDQKLPDIPSLYELGYKTCLYGTDFYILAAKDTDAATVEKMNEWIGKALADQSVIDVTNKVNMPLQYLNVKDSIDRVKTVSDKIAMVAAAVGLKQ